MQRHEATCEFNPVVLNSHTPAKGSQSIQAFFARARQQQEKQQQEKQQQEKQQQELQHGQQDQQPEQHVQHEQDHEDSGGIGLSIGGDRVHTGRNTRTNSSKFPYADISG